MPEHIRHRVLPSDRNAMRGLLEAVGSFSPQEIDAVEEQLRQHLSHGDASRYRLAFVERDGRLAGYVCFGPIPATQGSWNLHGILVHPDYQRQGWGTRLLQYAEKCLAAEAGRQLYGVISSRPHYQPTREFYGRAKFTLAATLSDFYAPGDDQLVFVKRLG